MTTRFSDRVQDYVRYRPTYAQAAIDLIARELGLGPDTTIADLGAGTGILTRQLAPTGTRIVAIDPSEPMLEAARAELEAGDRIEYRVASAEETGLPDASVDGIVAGQAFHWFDPERARVEFARILEPEGWVALVWNLRRKDETPFLAAYERLLETYRTDRGETEFRGRGDEMAHALFDPGPFRTATFENEQVLDLEGLKGRLLSTSYLPARGEPGSDEMLREVEELFDVHESDGRVRVEYDTKVYYGRLTPRE